MAIFGTLAPFVRLIPVSSGEPALYRALMASVLIGAVLLITRRSITLAGMDGIGRVSLLTAG